MTDRRCRFGLATRIEMVKRRQAGESLRQIARALACSPTTVKTMCDRFGSASEAERADFSCLLPRRPVPKSCPWALTAAQEQAILQAREKTNYGPMQLQYLTGRHRSTIHKVLARHGKSRQRRSQRKASTRRYEWAEAGALLHIDAFELPKFDRPGHWAHGDRSERHRTRGAGKVKVIGVIDDHTRLVYCEIHAAENAQTVSATLRRAAAWMRDQGCGPAQAVMSDNALCYARSDAFKAALAELGARHILIPPRTPRWNGKIERFFRTLDTEWAHGRVWPSSTQRDRALSSFIRYYNRRRPHTAAGGRAPITRVQQVRGQHS
jgi:transposase InsO family protein